MSNAIELKGFVEPPIEGHIDSEQVTHEKYLNDVRELVVARLNDEAARQRVLNAKLVYGSGPYGARGVCYYDAWENGQRHEFIEVCAFAERDAVQLAGTLTHELAHAIAGYRSGHGPVWKAAAHALGLIHAQAAGQDYSPSDFEPSVWARIEALELPSDGRPNFTQPAAKQQPTPGTGTSSLIPKTSVRPCSAGVGTKGGMSKGPGSGSRLIKVMCPDCAYSIWTTRKWLDVGIPTCGICETRMVEVRRQL